MKKISDIILWILIIISFLYGIVIFAYKGPYFWFNYIFIIISILLFIFLKIKKYFSKYIFYIINMLFILFVINFSVFLYHIFTVSKKEDNYKWIIILGAGINDGYPSYEYAKRLDLAIDNLNADAKVIVTGGKGVDEKYPESVVGFNYLLNKGIEKESIIIEDESLSTKANLENSKKIIGENGGSLDDNILIISSSFHLYRASLIAKELGFNNTFYKGSSSYKTFIVFNYFREYASLIKYKLF